MKHPAEYIIEFLKKNDIRQADLAKMAGVEHSTISNIKHRLVSMSPKIAKRLSPILWVSEEKLTEWHWRIKNNVKTTRTNTVPTKRDKKCVGLSYEDILRKSEMKEVERGEKTMWEAESAIMVHTKRRKWWSDGDWLSSDFHRKKWTSRNSFFN